MQEDIKQVDGSLELDTVKIDKAISRSPLHQFELKDQYLIKLFGASSIPDNKSNPLNKYLSNITQKDFTYIGILSENLTKETFGLNHYSQGDTYLGEWKNDFKHGTGLYYSNKCDSHEIYIGNWENGLRKGKGIIFSINADSLQSPLESTPFHVIIGEYNEGILLHAICFSQTMQLDRKPERLIYVGKYNKEGKKEDPDGIIIRKNSMFFGPIVNDTITQGLMLHFVSEKKDELKKFYAFNTTIKQVDAEQIKEIEYHQIKNIDKAQVDPHISIKQKYDLNAFYKNIENYYNSIVNLKEKYQSMTAFESISSIEEAITLMNQYNSFNNDITRPKPLFETITIV